MMRFANALLGSGILALCAGAASAQTPGDLGDLVGARAAGGENALRSRGYALVRSEAGDDRAYTYWWNAARRQCVSVATMEARYDSIVSTPAPDCRQPDGYDRPSPRGGQSYRPDVNDRGTGQLRREAPSYAGGERGYVQVQGQQVDLGLICFGDGQRPALATTYGWSWNSRQDRYDYGNRTELTARQFDASVTLQLWDGGGRIRLPKKLVTPINSRGADGWWDLYDVATGPDMIRAKYRLNGLNKPSITINRRSGQISIEGMAPYAFSGTCDSIDGEDHRRF